MDSPTNEVIGSVLGSLVGSGGVVWLIVRAAIAELKAEFEQRITKEREWAEANFVRRAARP